MNHLFPYIERTLIHPGVTISEQYDVLDEVTQLGLAGMTVAPFWVKKFRRELGETHPAVLATVVGFPFGLSAHRSQANRNRTGTGRWGQRN